MFFGNPDTYKFAPLIDSLLGLAKETCNKSMRDVNLVWAGRWIIKESYFNSLILQPKTVQSVDGFVGILLLLIINKPIAKTLS